LEENPGRVFLSPWISFFLCFNPAQSNYISPDNEMEYKEMRETTNIYKALSDTSRLRILMMLKEKALCVCEMTDILGLANSTVSKHLSILRNANLIQDEKDGRWVNYRLARPEESRDIDFVLTRLAQQLADDKQIALDKNKLRDVDRHAICATTNPSVNTSKQ